MPNMVHVFTSTVVRSHGFVSNETFGASEGRSVYEAQSRLGATSWINFGSSCDAGKSYSFIWFRNFCSWSDLCWQLQAVSHSEYFLLLSGKKKKKKVTPIRKCNVVQVEKCQNQFKWLTGPERLLRQRFLVPQQEIQEVLDVFQLWEPEYSLPSLCMSTFAHISCRLQSKCH